jgi:acyl-CoA synthetase (AMP-forming)/AMP-acid ligase II
MTLLPHVRFDNIYGPAEVNGVTHQTLEPLTGDDAVVPIGPIAETAEALIVDAEDAPVSPGQIGELLVRSPTMMLGYWGRQDLNARAFYRRRNSAGLEEVFFRTGDLVERYDDGVMRFVGRKDRQVKVRGYRVELDEIETALTMHAAVEEAAVYVLPDGEGSQAIHAQVTLTDDAPVQHEDFVKFLKSRLPWYAVPASVGVAARFPRTSTGKIDRRTLTTRAREADGAGG